MWERRFTVDVSSLVLLHALYLQIMYGDAEKAPEDVKEKVEKDVMERWSLLKGMTRERLYVSFASELASRNN